jgi:hypothetical protein
MSGLIIFIVVTAIAIIAWIYFYKKGSDSITESMKTAEDTTRRFRGVDDPFKSVTMRYTKDSIPHEITIDFSTIPVTMGQIISKASEKTKAIVVGLADKTKDGPVSNASNDVRVKTYDHAFVGTRDVATDASNDHRGLARLVLEGLHIYDASTYNISHLGDIRGPVIVVAKNLKAQDELISMGFDHLLTNIFIKNIVLVTKVDPVE